MKDEQRWAEGAWMGIIDKQAAGVRTIAGVATRNGSVRPPL
jgi:hypothetical protein